jgi:TolB-like protein
MANFFAELKRRHIYRVAATYTVVAWVLLQLFNNIEPILKLPDWAGSLVLFLLLGGFPVALLLALLLLLFLRPPAVPAAAPAEPATASRVVAPAARGEISLAVLPFLNLSRDPDQEFFSDGMTEEITSAIAKVPNLRVVARTSAFQFKGQNRDIQSIADALHATHLIEGSVRKDGNQVRITAQLIKADDGTHVWTESYDRELRGVFALQEEIAQAIATSLQVPLGLKQGEALVWNRTTDLGAYQEYLRARALFRARSINDAIMVLESVVARDPKFAPAWGLLASAYVLAPYYGSILRRDPLDQARRAVQSHLDKAENASREAVRLDSRSAIGCAGLGFVNYVRFKWAEAEDLYKKALELDPNDPDVMHVYSFMLADAGHIKRAIALREGLRALEPFVPIYNAITAGIMQINGNDDDAIGILEPISPDATGGFHRNFLLARAYAARAQFDKAADTLLLIKGNLVTRRSVEDAARLIRMPKRNEAPEKLPVLEGELGFVYTHIGAVDRILDYAERQLTIGEVVQGRDSLWLPLAAPARKTERFKAIIRRVGLVGYWRARGWPDLCHSVGTDDFVCD